MTIGLTVFFVFLLSPSWATGPGKDSDEQAAKKLGLTIDELRQLNEKFGMTKEMLLALPRQKMHLWYRKLAKTGVQSDRAAFETLTLKNKNGVIPEGAQLLAYDQLKNLFKKIKADSVLAGMPIGPTVHQRNLLPPRTGPKTKTAGWEELGPDRVGGRTRTLLVDPNDTSILYAGSACGGVWKSSDCGDTWDPLSDLQLANLAVCTMVMHPLDSRILYVGTGEGFHNADAVRGAGIFKTEDGGASWAPLPVPDKYKDAFQFVNRLAISSDGKVLLAAVGAVLDSKDPLYKSVHENAGIYRCTDPAKGNWQLVQKGYFGCVAFDPSTNAKAIAGGLGFSPEDQGQAFYSVNGGQTWKLAGNADNWVKFNRRSKQSEGARTELAYASAKPAIVYACVDMMGGQLWRSENGGQSFRRVKSKHHKGYSSLVLLENDQGWYDNVVWAGHPTNPDLVIVGGVDLRLSKNGGKTFEEISDWQSSQSAHADQHVIVAHPDFGKRNQIVYFGNDGGVYRAADLSTIYKHKGWTALSNRYVVTQFHGAAGHTKAGIILAGAQDNGTLKLVNMDTKAEKWETVWGGDGGFCAIDQDDPRYLYGEYIYLAIFRADPEGKVEFISGFREDGAKNNRLSRRPAPFNIADASNPEGSTEHRNANFIAPFILDPNNQKRMLAGGASLWVTQDARAADVKWEKFKDPVSKSNYISAIAVAKGNSDIIWVGYNSSEIYMTTNGLSPKRTWTRVDQPLPGRPVTRIVIDPKNSKHVYVMFSGYSKGNLWETEGKTNKDGQLEWHDLSKGLPEVPFRTLAIHPRKSDYLYLGTEIGVLISGNGGKSWGPTSQAAIGCRVDELFWMEETLVAATHGRGIFRTNLARAVPKD
jgi:hypothetical protein